MNSKSFAECIIEKYDLDYLNFIWSDKNMIDPYHISYGSNKKYVFNCINNANHEFSRIGYLYLKTQECPICKREQNSVGIKYPNSYLYWSQKNNTTPLDHSSMCGDIVFWKCNNNIHDDYRRTIKNSVLSNFECPYCRERKSHENTWNRLHLDGMVFGELTVESFANTQNGATYWNCKCSCGTKCVKNGNDLVSGKIITCGDKSFHNIAEKNPNWKGGLTEINYSERYTKDYSEWRSAVFKRDMYTCQCCGKSGGELQAHHIKDFSSYPDLRMDIGNGMTLCSVCHDSAISGSFHNVYGTIGKTPEELEEYINYKRKRLGISIPFSIEDYKNGDILKPGDITQEQEYPWIFDLYSIGNYKTENNCSSDYVKINKTT